MIRKTFLLLFSLPCCWALQAQTLVIPEHGESLEEMANRHLIPEEGHLSMPYGTGLPARWGDPAARDKRVLLCHYPDRVEGDGFSEGLHLVHVFEEQPSGAHLLFASDSAGHEALVGTYPRTGAIDSAAAADLDGDGVQECVLRFAGSMRCRVEFEEEDPETGEMTVTETWATCDHYTYAVLRQVREDGKWLPQFTMEMQDALTSEDDSGYFLSMPQAVQALTR